MMRALITASLLAVALGWAQHSIAAEDCTTIETLKSNPDLKKAKAKFVVFNSGQFHVLEGIYMATPPVSGVPDADGAFMVTTKKNNFVVFTKSGCAIPDRPMEVTDKTVGALRLVNPGSGEIFDDISQDERL